jgi:hypothetical protein
MPELATPYAEHRVRLVVRTLEVLRIAPERNDLASRQIVENVGHMLKIENGPAKAAQGCRI